MFKFRQKLSESERKPNYDTPKTRVYSYSDITKKNERVANQNKDKKKNLPKIEILTRWIIVLTVVFIIGWILSASVNPIVRIAEDEITIKPSTEYEQSVKTIIKSSLLNRSKITFDYLGFELKVKEKYTEVSSVETSFALIGNRPVVRLKFYDPVILVESLGKKWLVDNRGVVLSESTDDNSKLPRLTDEIGLATEVGGYILSSKDVEFILFVHKTAKEKGIGIEKYTTPLISKQLNVKVVGEGHYTKFNLSEDVKEQVGTWLASRDQLKNLGQTPTEYVDIRASEKVFWK